MVDNCVDWYCPQKIYLMDTSSRMLWSLPVSKIANLSWWGLLSQSYYHIMIFFQWFSIQGLVKVIKRPILWFEWFWHVTRALGSSKNECTLHYKATKLNTWSSHQERHCWVSWLAHCGGHFNGNLSLLGGNQRETPPNEPGRIHSGLWLNHFGVIPFACTFMTPKLQRAQNWKCPNTLPSLAEGWRAGTLPSRSVGLQVNTKRVVHCHSDTLW